MSSTLGTSNLPTSSRTSSTVGTCRPSGFGAIFAAAALRAAVVLVAAVFLAVVVFFAAVFLAVVVFLAAVFLAAVAVSFAAAAVSSTLAVVGLGHGLQGLLDGLGHGGGVLSHEISSSGLSSASGCWAEFSVWKAA